MPAARSMALAEGQIKAGVVTTGPFGVRPDHTLDGHILVAVSELKGSTAGYHAELQWSHNGQDFVSADPADALEISTAGGLVKHFQFKAPFFRLVETVSGGRASATRAVHIQYS